MENHGDTNSVKSFKSHSTTSLLAAQLDDLLKETETEVEMDDNDKVVRDFDEEVKALLDDEPLVEKPQNPVKPIYFGFPCSDYRLKSKDNSIFPLKLSEGKSPAKTSNPFLKPVPPSKPLPSFTENSNFVIIHDPEVASLPDTICEDTSRKNPFIAEKSVGKSQKPKPDNPFKRPQKPAGKPPVLPKPLSETVKKSITASIKVERKRKFAEASGKSFHVGMCADSDEKAAFYRRDGRYHNNRATRFKIALDFYNIDEGMIQKANEEYWKKKNEPRKGAPAARPSWEK